MKSEKGGEGAVPTPPRRTKTAALLAVCMAVVAAWLMVAAWNSRGVESFRLTSADFRGFVPSVAPWQTEHVRVGFSSIEPNIVAYLFRPPFGADVGDATAPTQQTARATVSMRLVHGYSMPECMQIKGYSVELIGDTRESAESINVPGALEAARDVGQVQIWRLVSNTGDESIWVTSMLNAFDMHETSVDTRAMPFPRVGIPDELDWDPEGITLDSLRHPIRGIRRALRAKWNKSRCDWLTFLGLRRPSWASTKLLTLVTTSLEPSAYARVNELSVVRDVLAVHRDSYLQLLEWASSRPGPLSAE